MTGAFVSSSRTASNCKRHPLRYATLRNTPSVITQSCGLQVKTSSFSRVRFADETLIRKTTEQRREQASRTAAPLTDPSATL